MLADVAPAAACSEGEEASGEPLLWGWKENLEVAYVHKGQHNTGPAVLLVPGFGVGSFHYER